MLLKVPAELVPLERQHVATSPATPERALAGQCGLARGAGGEHKPNTGAVPERTEELQVSTP